MSQSTGRVARGEEIQQWMSDPTHPGCDIDRIDLTWRDLHRSPEWILHDQTILLPKIHMDWMREIGFPEERDLHDHSESVYRQVSLKNFTTGTTWMGRTGPGKLRFWGSLHIRVNPGCLKHDFDLDTLRYVYVKDIGNKDTKAYIEEEIDEPEIDIGDQGVTYSSEEMVYKGMLGTKVGKMVSYFILGAYGQGVKHITQIHVSRPDNTYHIRFKVEDV
ncbi:unnamed protein product [Penicillium palitans]